MRDQVLVTDATAPRERHALLTLIALVACFFSASLTVADPDLWGHTLYGLRCLDAGILVERTDPFSYTAPGATWINHEWLTEYQFGWLWRYAGNVGLWLWRNTMVLVVFAVVAWNLHRTRATLAASGVLLIFGAGCLAEFTAFIRPQLATFALFAVTLAILREHWDRPSSRLIWLLPVLVAAWVNLHGGFLAGIGILGVFVAGWGMRVFFHHGDTETRRFQKIEDRESKIENGQPRLRQLDLLSSIFYPRFLSASQYLRGEFLPCVQLVAVFVLSVAATLINPYGVTMHAMLWDHLMPEQAVREWQSLWAARQSAGYYVPFVMLLLALPGWRRARWIDLAVLAVVTWQAVSHIRHVALLCIAAMILLPEPLSAALPRLLRHPLTLFSGPSHRFRRWTLTAIVLGGMLALRASDINHMAQFGIHPWEVATEVHRDVPGVPERAVRLLAEENIHGNLVTDYGWGQYVIWHLFPGSRVAFDGRYRTVYPADLEQEFLAFQKTGKQQPARTPLLDDYESEIVLLPAQRGPCAYLDVRTDWVCIYRDTQAALYLRDIPRFQDVIQRARTGMLVVADNAGWQSFPAGPVVGRFDKFATHPHGNQFTTAVVQVP